MTRTPDIDRRTVRNAVLIVVLVAVAAPFVVSAVPQVVGADHSYTVLSSSMSPQIKAGDQVVVQSTNPTAIHENDVITFRPPSGEYGGAMRVTHRVVGVDHKNGERYFRTKGDANNAPDPDLVPASNVVGVVWFDIPKIGYVLQYASTPIGRVAFVVIPLSLLAISELYDFLVADDEDGERAGEPK